MSSGATKIATERFLNCLKRAVWKSKAMNAKIVKNVSYKMSKYKYGAK